MSLVITLPTPDGPVEYVTAVDVVARWGDVRASMLRGWARSTRYRPPLVTALTVGELAALTGQPLGDRDPDRPARQDGRNLYRWDDLLRADLNTREHTRARRGQRRKQAPGPVVPGA